MANPFEQYAISNPKEVTQDQDGSNPFLAYAKENPPPEESFLKSSLRTALQIPQGLAELTKYGIGTGIQQFLGAGEALDPEEIDRIRAISEREGIPFNEESYLESVQNALGSVPTVSNIGSAIEAKTGIPLEPKTRTQKGIRFLSQATKASPKGFTIRGADIALPKPVLGAAIAGTKEIAQELGVPEPIAELGSFAILKRPREGSGSISIGKKTKPSGMTERQFEKITKPTEISPSALKRINEKTESEFRSISDKIIKESPQAETFKNLSEDVTFKQKSQEAFQDVQDLAETLPNKIKGKIIKENLDKKILQRKQAGITPDEFDVALKSQVNGFIKSTPDKPFTTADLVTQYRKNNKNLKDVFEPGQSFAHNSAKREALLEYNRVIGDIIETEYPNSEFSKIFKETNKRWAEISDAETINKFIDGMFDGKIKFNEGRKLFDKNGATIPFKRAMGQEGFSKFETLMKDLISTERASKLLKEAESQGFNKLAQTGLSFLIHPTAGQAKFAYDAVKGGYKGLYNFVIDKPQYAITWDRGINAIKAKNFKVAEQEFDKILKAQASELEKSRVESLKNFNQKKAK
jgi:hypothetical protein